MAGVDLADLGKVTPRVFTGEGESSENSVAVLHVSLPDTHRAEVDIINLFHQGQGDELTARAVTPVFSCNCILNYQYGELEGKTTGQLVGPITFGELAYMLLNQTLVYLDFVRV